MGTVLLIYSLFLFWLLGGFTSKKKKDKPKSPEEELGAALTKYLSQTNKPAQKS